MKKLFITLMTIIVISSCSTTKEAKTSRIELRKEKKYAEQEAVKASVESKRFIIKLDRLYFTRGGMVDLVPRKNFIIIDGDRAIINAAYLGRQYNIRPVSGIRMAGEAKNYEMESDSLKGTYKIKLQLNNSVNSLNIYLSIDKSGVCNASLSNLRIDNVLYKGYIVPIKEKTDNTSQEGITI